MPYPSEHAARLRSPNDFEQGSFRRVNDKFGAGIHAIFGRLKGKNDLTTQAIRFDKAKYTVEEAKAWLDQNGYKPMLFEAASEGDAKKQAVSAAALRFNIGEFTITDANKEGSKSAPLKMSIRNGKAIEHWFWGKVAHDMSGMRLNKGRVAVDYNHNPDEVIGYLNHFDISGDSIMGSGALCPYKDNDRASEVIHKAREGVPYEASINFAGGDTVIEEVPEGKTAECNGFELTGPATIFREWTLRGVAVCPYGADMNTSTQLATKDTVDVRVMRCPLSEDQDKEKQMADHAEAEAAKLAAVEAEARGKAKAEAEKLAAVEVERKAKEAADAEAAKLPGMKFIAAFGDQGAVWFAKGMSFERAQVEFTQSLKKENEALRANVSDLVKRLAAFAQNGEAAPAAPSAPPPAPAPASGKTFMELAHERAKEKGIKVAAAMSQIATENPEAYALHRRGGKK